MFDVREVHVVEAEHGIWRWSLENFVVEEFNDRLSRLGEESAHRDRRAAVVDAKEVLDETHVKCE